MTLNHLERLMIRNYLGIQLELISWHLDFEDLDMTEEKRKNWEKLRDTLSQVTLLLHECENEFTRLTNEPSEHRLRVLEDAEKLGRIAANVDHITEENTRLKECLGLALDLLAKHEIPHTIWHN